MDLYVPNGNLDCDNCGTLPTVDIRDPEHPQTLRHTFKCGVCLFGDRLMIDPDFWNEAPEATE